MRDGAASGPDGSSTSPTAARVRASRVIHPTVSNDGASGSTPSTGTTPCVGRRPNSPQQLAGTRIEPPVSVPSPMSASPAATAEAGPLDEPPVTSPGAAGFGGV